MMVTSLSGGANTTTQEWHTGLLSKVLQAAATRCEIVVPLITMSLWQHHNYLTGLLFVVIVVIVVVVVVVVCTV